MVCDQTAPKDGMDSFHWPLGCWSLFGSFSGWIRPTFCRILSLVAPSGLVVLASSVSAIGILGLFQLLLESRMGVLFSFTWMGVVSGSGRDGVRYSMNEWHNPVSRLIVFWKDAWFFLCLIKPPNMRSFCRQRWMHREDGQRNKIASRDANLLYLVFLWHTKGIKL